MGYTKPGKEVYRNVVAITTHSAGLLQKEIRGSDIPPQVEAIFIKVPDASKANVRTIREFIGSNAPSLSQGSQITRSPVELTTSSPPRKGSKLFSRIPEDSSIRCHNNCVVYGLY
tara:strand:+ start:55 stop:399 length:345 start_codon:yes stop_codon:yes gene_type:complete